MTEKAERYKRELLEVEEIRSRINKMMAETSKLNSENKFYPLIVSASVTLAIITVVKLFL